MVEDWTEAANRRLDLRQRFPLAGTIQFFSVLWPLSSLMSFQNMIFNVSKQNKIVTDIANTFLLFNILPISDDEGQVFDPRSEIIFPLSIIISIVFGRNK